MAQFDYYRSGSDYLLDVQSTLMDGLNTRICVPLMLVEEAPKPANRLNPIFIIRDWAYVMVTQFMAAVPVSELSEKIGSLQHEHDTIKPAVDMLFDGV
jgi:toxin CcdB